MQNVTGGTSPLPPVRPPAAPDASPPTDAIAAALAQPADPADGVDALQLDRGTGFGTGFGTTGARPSMLSLPGYGRADAAPQALEVSGLGDGMPAAASPDDIQAATDTFGYTTQGTGRGTTGTRR